SLRSQSKGLCCYFTFSVRSDGIMKKTYEYHGDSGTWSDAFNACTRQNSELASITSEEEQSKFNETAQNNTQIWIGLRRYVWKWSSGELFQNLAPGLELLPDDNSITNQESCAKMTTNNNAYKIKNEKCSETNSFLCYAGMPMFKYLFFMLESYK
uniref:C-type lectin domain-containing protein n=1 Tax=Astyanax mexicanus TaxID=7994 RepID=A0A3B1J0I7_ASTMX